jgi:hypothetical protein
VGRVVVAEGNHGRGKVTLVLGLYSKQIAVAGGGWVHPWGVRGGQRFCLNLIQDGVGGWGGGAIIGL